MKTLSVAALLLCAAVSAAHAGVVYNVTLDTSNIQTQTGQMFFAFSPGFAGDSQSATAVVSNSNIGFLDPPTTTGTLSGDPTASLTLSNDGSGASWKAFNWNPGWGPTLSFTLTLTGPAIDSPDGTSLSGSSFAFAMLDDFGNPILTTDTFSGYVFSADILLDGTAEAFSSSDQVVLTPVASGVPEPGSFALMAVATGIAAWLRVRRRRG